jgi:hypothetical protein
MAGAAEAAREELERVIEQELDSFIELYQGSRRNEYVDRFLLFNEQEFDRFNALEESRCFKYVERFCEVLLTEAPPSTHPHQEPSECLNPDCFDVSEDYEMLLFNRRYTHIHQEVYDNMSMFHISEQGTISNVKLPFCTICSLKYFNVKIAPRQDHIYSSITNANNRPLIDVEKLPSVQLVIRDINELPTLRLYRQPKDFVRFMSRAYAFWRGVDHWRSNDWCNVLEACHRSAYEACVADAEADAKADADTKANATPFLPN